MWQTGLDYSKQERTSEECKQSGLQRREKLEEDEEEGEGDREREGERRTKRGRSEISRR